MSRIASRAGPSIPMRLDAVVERALSTPVEGVRRAELVQLQSLIAPARAEAGIQASLTEQLRDFIMPRLRDPTVLMGDRPRAALEATARAMRHSGHADLAARSGLRALEREIERISTLRRRRNELIEG